MRLRLIQPPLVQPRYRQLTLAVVGAEFAAQGFDVEVCDENLDELDFSPVDLVGITCHVYNAPRAFEIAARFRQMGVPVLFGGTFPTVAPELVASHCDSVVVGELEGQTARIAADARAGHLAPLYRPTEPPSLAHTVRPDFSLLKNKRYLHFNFPIETSRGCRFACRFCTARTLFPQPRTRALADIERDLAQYDHGLVEVVDVNFLHDAAFFRKVLPLLSNPRLPGWTGQTTVLDLANDPKLPGDLAASGCKAVFVGLETVADSGLRSLNKGWVRPAQFLEVAGRMNAAGVMVQAGIIVGLDSDTPELLQRTADLLEEAQVQTVSITYLHYYPGTAQYEQAEREGLLLGRDWQDLDGNHLVVRPGQLLAEQHQQEVDRFLERIYSLRSIVRRAAHREMARIPKQLLHHLMLNMAMRTYYRELKAARSQDDPARRYMRRPDPDGWVTRFFADLGSWLTS